MNLHLGDVEETDLIPLAVRANESKRKNARISDPKAVEIIDALGIDTRNLDKLVTHECVVARTILFDDLTKSYIRKYPDAVCINLGCGLDDQILFAGETTFSEQMKKGSVLSKVLGAIIGDMNNRLSVFEWGN